MKFFKLSKVKIFLLAIIVIASVLRLWQLGNVPASPDWDEVSLGYNAYSIMQTGRDEFGKLLPIVMRSYNDYKPAFYSYLAIPSIQLFGLNTFATRLPSAVLGILYVLATYFLVKELFSSFNVKSKILNSENIALFSAFLLAISPWSIQFSRVAFEANAALAFNIFSILFFLKGLKKTYFLYFSVFFAALSIYTYQSEKIFVPLLAIFLLLIFRQKLLTPSFKKVIGPFLFGLILMLPMIFFLLTNKASLERARSTSIFFTQTQGAKTNSQNQEVTYGKEILSGYLSHFNLNWLFIEGDNSRHHAPGMGILYLFELPLILIGIYKLIFGKFDKKTKLTIFAWFLIAPIPASITFEVPHAVRTLNFLPTWQIFAALGIVSILDWSINLTSKKQKLFYFAAILYLIFSFLNFSYYLNQYFVQMNYYNFKDYNGAVAWQYGYKQAVLDVKDMLKQKNYDKVVVSNQQPMDQSYMFFLFYLKYPPREYQLQGNSSSFGKYNFRPINWEVDSQEKNVLYIGTPNELKSVNNATTINYPDGTPAMKIVGT